MSEDFLAEGLDEDGVEQARESYAVLQSDPANLDALNIFMCLATEQAGLEAYKKALEIKPNERKILIPIIGFTLERGTIEKRDAKAEKERTGYIPSYSFCADNFDEVIPYVERLPGYDSEDSAFFLNLIEGLQSFVSAQTFLLVRFNENFPDNPILREKLINNLLYFDEHTEVAIRILSGYNSTDSDATKILQLATCCIRTGNLEQGDIIGQAALNLCKNEKEKAETADNLARSFMVVAGEKPAIREAAHEIAKEYLKVVIELPNSPYYSVAVSCLKRLDEPPTLEL